MLLDDNPDAKCCGVITHSRINYDIPSNFFDGVCLKFVHGVMCVSVVRWVIVLASDRQNRNVSVMRDDQMTGKVYSQA